VRVGVGVEVVGDPAFELRRWQGADLAGNLAAVAPHDQCRDALDAELAGHPGRFIHIDLDGLETAGETPTDLLDGGSHRSTRTAPRRPQIDQHRDLGVYGRGEAAVRGVDLP